MSVRILGRLHMCRWESKKGERRSSVEVICTHLEYRPLSKGKAGQVEIIEDENGEAEMLSDCCTEQAQVYISSCHKGVDR